MALCDVVLVIALLPAFSAFCSDFSRDVGIRFLRPSIVVIELGIKDARASGFTALSFPLCAEWLATTVHRLGIDSSGKGGRVGPVVRTYDLLSFAIELTRVDRDACNESERQYRHPHLPAGLLLAAMSRVDSYHTS
ncbi:DNA-directed RNA polymerase III subunit rpc1-like [Dorcoceras hygrometricum]|uniref:DNA-directed RNA polymerase III subunit rpc1-like n=1 Tax=Dorcoceras hygrometricum TaxID=472368 RepID=A0A2Z7B9A2_9LAMI|nr:DNA-directed RNA polymerase III subunit rpc1-like [Dorcoceras hygrometricum]